MNIEGLNYNVHMQSRAYYSQFELALVQSWFKIFTESSRLMSSLSTRVVSL